MWGMWSCWVLWGSALCHSELCLAKMDRHFDSSTELAIRFQICPDMSSHSKFDRTWPDTIPGTILSPPPPSYTSFCSIAYRCSRGQLHYDFMRIMQEYHQHGTPLSVSTRCAHSLFTSRKQQCTHWALALVLGTQAAIDDNHFYNKTVPVICEINRNIVEL